MRYEGILRAIFRNRPNRFLAEVEIDGAEAVAHVKNTGRCKELLVPGAAVYLQDFGALHEGRKTRFDLIAVEKGSLLVNMDAQAPNRVFLEWAQAQKDGRVWRPETTWGTSRFDFFWSRGAEQGFVEVKGVTLEENGVVRFPDAPTERGVKHLRELIRLRESGLSAGLCFVIQLERATVFRPNDATHPAFGQALRAAAAAGVELTARRCRVTPETLTLADLVPIDL